MEVIAKEDSKKNEKISVDNLRNINLFIEIKKFYKYTTLSNKNFKKMKLNLNFVSKLPKLTKDNEIILLKDKTTKNKAIKSLKNSFLQINFS